MEIFGGEFVSGGHISLAGDSPSWGELWLSANIYLKDYSRDASERTGPLSSRSLPHCCQKKQRKYLGLWKFSAEDSSQVVILVQPAILLVGLAMPQSGRVPYHLVHYRTVAKRSKENTWDYGNFPQRIRLRWSY
ncbi:hypothetical protein CDAR_388781 [Caerostris darwini]|uniref:Uncharacterized protein n=1 Tax=Caerostris darwini TaxID=1538125 RepID=A0AAV4S7D9_9ARAC|nr:hypothetical protein CDAR_388781 [Caerostris darwini]